MRLGGRVQAAIEVIDDMDAHKRPAGEALKDWGLSHRFAGAGDRAAIGNIVYDVLRRRLSFSWRMDSDETRNIAFAALLDDGGMTLDEINSAFTGDRFAPPPLSSEQVAAWQSRDLHNAPDYIAADVPEWTKPHLETLFGERWLKEGAALSARPPLDVRINQLKATPEKVLKELNHTGAAPVAWFPQALRIAPISGLGRHPNVQVEAGFQKGWFEIQDLGSQVSAHLAAAKAGAQVLDYCAGAGGKTMALSADMENRGQVHAFDADKSRLAPIFERLKRAGVRNAQVHSREEELASLQGQMDIVLVDAPCTGTGTWRRRPDAKWRLTENQLEQRSKDQCLVLDKASAFVKPGGHLVYITCSLFSVENDAQITNFLERDSTFAEIDMKARWQMMHNAPTPHFPRHGLVLSPASTDTDGFFVSVLQKKG